MTTTMINRFGKRATLCGSVLVTGLTLLAVCAEEPWRKVKDVDGRELEIQIQEVADGKVTFRTRRGTKSYTLFLTKFSDEDRKMLRNWRPTVSKINSVKEDSVVRMSAETGTSTTYQSKHFEYEFDTVAATASGLTTEEVKASIPAKMAPGFEMVYWGFTGLPVAIEPKPEGTHFKVKVISKENDFPLISGERLSETQPGTYSPPKGTFFGLQERLMEPSPELTYELTFALLGDRLVQLPPWLAVAFAEYLAAAPMKGGQLSFEDPLKNMVDSLENRHGMSEESFGMLAPDAILASDFARFRTLDPASSRKARASALLLLHYFAAVDGDGSGNALGDYFRAVRTSSDREEAIKVLVGERTMEKLADDIRVGYLTKGLKVEVR